MDSDANIVSNLESLVASVAATIQFSLLRTKKMGGASKLNSATGSDFFLGYVAGFSDALVQAAGGESQGAASMALVERSLLRLFGEEGAKNLFASIEGAISGKFAQSEAFGAGLTGGSNDARQIVTDKEGACVGKSFIAWYVPEAPG